MVCAPKAKRQVHELKAPEEEEQRLRTPHRVAPSLKPTSCWPHARGTRPSETDIHT